MDIPLQGATKHQPRDHILAQDDEYGYSIVNDQMQVKSKIRQENQKRDQDEAQRIYTQLPDRLQKADTIKEKRCIYLAYRPTTN